MSSQLELFHVQEAYAKADKPLSNEELYDSVAELAGIPKSALNEQSEIGKAKVKR
ncbi:site-specific DNA-methyltransferase, partial [Salmonella enterica]|nr:site-specific DNA-methyltransferase [Salmonella enterica]